MRIEAVITCVQYADFLAHSLPENLQHLDHVVVVTSHDDKATKDLCNHLGVVCVQTDVFTEHGDKFNKGRGINIGMAHCRNDGLMLHIDADTVLPHRFRATLNMAKPDPACLYGADRLYVKNFEQWSQTKDKLVPQFQDGCHVIPNHDLKMGSRLLHGDYGYCPIGYFQLWNSHTQQKQYPGNAGSSEHSDVLFALQWPRAKRVLLPQMFVYHLESESAPMGTNWQGRKTRAFCPCHSYALPGHLAYQEKIVEMGEAMTRHHNHDHHHHHPCPYRPHKHHHRHHNDHHHHGYPDHKK